MGEWHDHAGNHLAEMALFCAVYERAPGLTLSMEMFERDVQPVLDDYLAGRIGEANFRRKGRAWGNYAESYRPLVEFAKDHTLPVIAANVPASVVRCVGAEGAGYLARMPADKRGMGCRGLILPMVRTRRNSCASSRKTAPMARIRAAPRRKRKPPTKATPRR